MDLSTAPDPDVFTQEAQSEEDKKLLVRFVSRSRQDKAASLEQGRAVFKDIAYVEIMTPGSKDKIARPATDRDIMRFPRHYEAFQKRMEAPLEGTPLAEWPMITRALADELAFINVKTVEQLAELRDSAAGNMLGIQGFKQKAKDWLEMAKDDAPLMKLRAELEVRDAQLAAQEQTIKDLAARLDAMEQDTQQRAAAAQQAAPCAPLAPTALDTAPPAEEQLELSVPAPAPVPEPEPENAATQRRRRRRRSAQE